MGNTATAHAAKGRKKSGTRALGKKKALRLAAIGVALLAALSFAAYFANRYLEMRTYKLEYAGEILENAAPYGLDAYLVAAIIHCESGGRKAVVSYKGAVGLMQIMPATGAWIAEKLGLKDYQESMLYEPATNIALGCWYLDYLIDRYGGNIVCALAAYNAGPGNVDKWLADEAKSENGALKDIPFPETREYVERVQRAVEKYNDLYQDKLG